MRLRNGPDANAKDALKINSPDHWPTAAFVASTENITTCARGFAATHLKEWVLIQGRVIQVIGKDGVLLRPYGMGAVELIRVRRYHAQDQLIDGSKVEGFFIPDGRYQYETVVGGGATILSFDYGELITEQEYAKAK